MHEQTAQEQVGSLPRLPVIRRQLHQRLHTFDEVLAEHIARAYILLRIAISLNIWAGHGRGLGSRKYRFVDIFPGTADTSSCQ